MFEYVLIGHSILTTTALVLAAMAWRHVGSYVRQARVIVQMHRPLIAEIRDWIEDTREPDTDTVEDTDQIPIYTREPEPEGRHALQADRRVCTRIMPTVGDLDEADSIRIPPYVRSAR